jgi:hypothetical protein
MMTHREKHQIQLNELAEKKEYLQGKIAETLLLRHNMTLKGSEVDGQYVGMDWVYERNQGYSLLGYTGNIRLYIGTYGDDRRLFRTLKTGEMKYEKIADELKLRYDNAVSASKYYSKVESLRKANEKTREEIAEACGLDSIYTTGLEVSYHTGDMSFNIGNLTKEDACAFVNLAIERGLIKKSRKTFCPF